MSKTIGIIGFGNMGQAIAEQLKIDYQAQVFDKDKNKTRGLSGIKIAQASADLAKNSDVLILAIKPQDFEGLLVEIKDFLSADKLIISIAAGITTAYIEKCLGVARIIRAMPNILIKIGASVTCLSKGKFATEQDLEFAENLFGYMGETLEIKEEMMNAATAVSGSGPAYICYYIEAGLLDPNNIPEQRKQAFLAKFKKAAQTIGFNQEEASFLVNNTFNSTINFLKKTKVSAKELKKQVASKGGTTEAALEILKKGGSLEEAVEAARKRAQEGVINVAHRYYRRKRVI